jgi:hypothetical protein
MEEGSHFITNVRRYLGRFNAIVSQSINIFPREPKIQVWTLRPEVERDDPPIDRGHVRQALELNKWYLLTVETVDNDFEILLDDERLLSYEDPEALPGTVQLGVSDFHSATEVEVDYIRIVQGGHSVEPLSYQLKSYHRKQVIVDRC